MIIGQVMQEVDDAQLAKAARKDTQAFDMLYRRHVTAVYRYCYARTGCPTEAEDLTAQTFLSALESLSKYRGRGSFAAWIFGIARRKCADYHRQRYRKKEETLETAVPLPDTTADSPEQQAYRRTIADCVQASLPELSENKQDALYLRFWGGLSVRETAAALRKSEGAVKMLVSRAITDLKERCLTHEPL